MLLVEVTDIICDKFPERKDGQWTNPYVHERFSEDWKPDTTWGWQQNRDHRP